ncbi:hypothetical protein PV350_13920 [Streptomyces sp. PA03-6a]|nr:hypothetical protein [Streptomyces sp. PA03-6a]
MPETTKPRQRATYPGRTELDAAESRLRRALARCGREAARHDPKLIPKLAEIVGEATEHILRVAADIEALESTSARHRRDLEQAEEGMKRVLQRAARRGSPQAARMLARMQERPLSAHQKPSDGSAGGR